VCAGDNPRDIGRHPNRVGQQRVGARHLDREWQASGGVRCRVGLEQVNRRSNLRLGGVSGKTLRAGSTWN